MYILFNLPWVPDIMSLRVRHNVLTALVFVCTVSNFSALLGQHNSFIETQKSQSQICIFNKVEILRE